MAEKKVVIEERYITKIDEASNTVTYVGKALPGSGDSDSVWQIKKIDETTGILILFAGGSTSYVNRWDQRTILVYS